MYGGTLMVFLQTVKMIHDGITVWWRHLGLQNQTDLGSNPCSAVNLLCNQIQISCSRYSIHSVELDSLLHPHAKSPSSCELVRGHWWLNQDCGFNASWAMRVLLWGFKKWPKSKRDEFFSRNGNLNVSLENEIGQSE